MGWARGMKRVCNGAFSFSFPPSRVKAEACSSIPRVSDTIASKLAVLSGGMGLLERMGVVVPEEGRLAFVRWM